MGNYAHPQSASAMSQSTSPEGDAEILWGAPRHGGLRGLSAWSRAIPEAAAGEIPPLQVWPWTAEEDAILLEHVRVHGTRKWKELVESGRLPRRGTKACCNRYRRLKLGQVAGSEGLHHSYSISPELSSGGPAPTTASAPLLQQSSTPSLYTLGVSPPAKRQRSEGAGAADHGLRRRGSRSLGDEEYDVTSSPPTAPSAGTSIRRPSTAAAQSTLEELLHQPQSAAGEARSRLPNAGLVVDLPSPAAPAARGHQHRPRFVDADLEEWIAMGPGQDRALEIPPAGASVFGQPEALQSVTPESLERVTQEFPRLLNEELQALEALLGARTTIRQPSEDGVPGKALQGSSRSRIAQEQRGHPSPQRHASSPSAGVLSSLNQADVSFYSTHSLPAQFGGAAQSSSSSLGTTLLTSGTPTQAVASLAAAEMQQGSRVRALGAHGGSFRERGRTEPVAMGASGSADLSAETIRLLASMSSDTTLVNLVRQLTEALEGERAAGVPATGASGHFAGAPVAATGLVPLAQGGPAEPSSGEAWGAGLSPLDLLRLLSASSIDSSSLGLSSPMADTPSTKGSGVGSGLQSQLASMALDTHLRELQHPSQHAPVRTSSAPQGSLFVGEATHDAPQEMASQGPRLAPSMHGPFDESCIIEELAAVRSRTPTAPRLSEHYVQSSSWASTAVNDSLSSGNLGGNTSRQGSRGRQEDSPMPEQ